MQANFNPGDLIRYTYWEDEDDFFVKGECVKKVEMLGVVLRGGAHNAYVLLNGQQIAGWISDEYLEAVSHAS